MHESAREYVERQVRDHNLESAGAVLEIGGRNVNGTISDLFKGTYVALDIAPGEGVDVVADGADWESPEPIDVVVCCETLEHTYRAAEIISRAHSNLRAGGVLILTTACSPRMPHSAWDGCLLREGEYYSNIEDPTLAAWFDDAGFSHWSIETKLIPDHGGDIYGIAWKSGDTM